VLNNSYVRSACASSPINIRTGSRAVCSNALPSPVPSCLGGDVLLMDEPFAALDVQIRVQMQSLLLDIWQGLGKTVVFVMHHIDEAISLADRVIILTAHRGRLLDCVSIDVPCPRKVINGEFERY
jgi:NitT/TauT family transport system ATP-binding protein